MGEHSVEKRHPSFGILTMSKSSSYSKRWLFGTKTTVSEYYDITVYTGVEKRDEEEHTSVCNKDKMLLSFRVAPYQLIGLLSGQAQSYTGIPVTITQVCNPESLPSAKELRDNPQPVLPKPEGKRAFSEFLSLLDGLNSEENQRLRSRATNIVHSKRFQQSERDAILAAMNVGTSIMSSLNSLAQAYDSLCKESLQEAQTNIAAMFNAAATEHKGAMARLSRQKPLLMAMGERPDTSKKMLLEETESDE